ncbi:MAG: TM0106 family RecB-like putative nuclease [Bdellovibrionales bacterium]
MLIKASDAKSWDSCHRRVWFDNNPPPGFESVEAEGFEQLIIEKGNQLEQKYLQQFRERHQVVEARSVEHTQELIAAGTEVIYQGTFNKDGIIGKPDFLFRQASGAYQPADVKLAHSAEDKKPIQIQLGIYRKLLGTELPAIAYLGTGKTEEVGDEVDKKVDAFLSSMKTILASKQSPDVRFSESKCKACPYAEACKPIFEEKGELTLLYGIESRAAPGLEQQGFHTIRQLSEADPTAIVDVPYLKGLEKRQRAVLQAQAYLNGNFYQLRPLDLPQGTWVHFDIEDNPLTDSGQKHVYLWGFLKPNFGDKDFEYIWTDKDDEDREGWERFLAKVETYKSRYPDLVLAHFSPHERITIEAYAARYDMQNHPTVAWLLGDASPLFDMLPSIKASLVLPLASYGLKYICKHPKLVNFQWKDAGSGSQWSVVQFARFLETEAPAEREELKKNILTYNFDDVMATRMLELWLRSLDRKSALKSA